MVFIPGTHYMVAAVGFVIIGTGMGPVYPAIQHMTPVNFGKKIFGSCYRPSDGIGVCGQHIYADGIRNLAGAHRDSHYACVSADICDS
jgi:hypothetical protein